ncbi:tyrosine-type recombinase/integrase [Kitasatospora sp. McL0602]|uniref:tyrosine-type recombinase/integrase n=1 Tax=Kitasatospora sp. McL0602 TaxID=3439530 RepID=UPI003F8A3950
MDQLLTVEEAAKLLGTWETSGERFPRRLITERRIAFVKVGHHVRIPARAIADYIVANTVKPDVSTRQNISRRRRENTAPVTGRRRQFGSVRRLPSGRYQARYLDPNGIVRPGPQTFESDTEADAWLAVTQGEINNDNWRDPSAGAVNFSSYADAWISERGLMPTTLELYRRLLRTCLVPAFGGWDLDQITPPHVRAWRAQLLATGKVSTAAKAYRLLRAIMATASDDELIRRNPCRIEGGGKESPKERGIATIEQVYELAELVGARWRAMVLLAAFTTLRPEELAELRRSDIDLEASTVRVHHATPELNTGRRAPGGTKTEAGRRTITMPAAIVSDVRVHLKFFAESGPQGLVFIGEKGAPFRRTSFGRIWRKARVKAGMPDFRFYDLRHTGNTLAASTGASLKELMVRMGHASVQAALIYQHATHERDGKIADGIDAEINRLRREG